MGMFDYVSGVPETQCPKCKAPLSGWQTKDGGNTLDYVDWHKVDRFYTRCGTCAAFVSYNRRPPVDISEYELLEEG